MSWNYRICKFLIETVPYEYETVHEIREVYYNKDGSIYAVSSAACPVYSDTDLNGIIDVLGMMARAVNREVLDLDSLVFAPVASEDYDEDNHE